MRVADMHCDTISRLKRCREDGRAENLRENSGHVDLNRLARSGCVAQNFALFVNQGTCADPWEEVLALLALYEEELEKNADRIRAAKCCRDLGENEKTGRLSSLLTVEEGGVCKGEPGKLGFLYEKGVRMLTLTWNYPNELGAPNLCSGKGREVRERYRGSSMEADRALKAYLNTPDTQNGLTEKGIEFVARMEALGMIVDVSHLSDKGFYDVLAHSRKPFVASHSNARAVCPCVRNLTDDMIRKLSERGGVMGLNFCADFLAQKPAGEPNPGKLKDVAAHAKHIVNVGGIGCLGLGGDFDGIDTNEELPGVEKLGLLWETLETEGFLPSQIERIFSENVLRLYREVL
ncbi:MAG: membrane dipeptidase [Clostridium sp.]|jgi:membrane dipeptidase|nr:membrane dipeptidase [Clostridium sp.]